MNAYFHESMLTIYTQIFAGATLYILFALFVKWYVVKRGAKIAKTNRKPFIQGVVLLYLALILNLAETDYFGWNHIAKSSGEWAMDSITTLLTIIGIWMVYSGIYPTPKRSQSAKSKK